VPAARADLFKEAEAVAKTLGLRLQSVGVRGPDDFESAFKAAKSGGAEALIVIANPLANTYRARIVDLAAKNRLPGIYPSTTFVEDGGLMSYAPDIVDNWRRAAIYVDKILKGAKPADLPVEQPKKFEFVINLKAAKQIGVTIPPNVLARATRIIR
jgi:putative tryptophan/tyrosine transport system substrate-binding protein